MVISKKIKLILLSTFLCALGGLYQSDVSCSIKSSLAEMNTISELAETKKKIILETLDNLIITIDIADSNVMQNTKDVVAIKYFEDKIKEVSEGLSGGTLSNLRCLLTADIGFEKDVSNKIKVLTDKIYKKLESSNCKSTFVDKNTWDNCSQMLDGYIKNKREYQRKWYRALSRFTIDPTRKALSTLFLFGKTTTFLLKYKIGKLAMVLGLIEAYQKIPFVKEVAEPVVCYACQLLGIISENPSWSEWLWTSLPGTALSLPTWVIGLILWNVIS